MSSSSPYKTIHAIDAFLTRAQDSPDFSEDEIARVEKVRKICLDDISILEDARRMIAQNKHTLARKEESLSAFMEMLGPGDMNDPIIKKMLESFMDAHIKLGAQVRRVEKTLHEMYPNWTSMELEEHKVSEVNEGNTESAQNSQSDFSDSD